MEFCKCKICTTKRITKTFQANSRSFFIFPASLSLSIATPEYLTKYVENSSCIELVETKLKFFHVSIWTNCPKSYNFTVDSLEKKGLYANAYDHMLAQRKRYAPSVWKREKEKKNYSGLRGR